MAATNAPLVWDCYRVVSGANSLAGVAHYYDEQSQSLYLKGGKIATQVAEVPDGHWKTATPGAEIVVTDDSFTVMRLDHPSNGILYAAATNGTSLTFLRYRYSMEVFPITDSWSWLTQSDNAIAQFSASLQNVGVDIFMDDVTLFQPGARITMGFRMGTSEAYPIGTAWMDECIYDVAGETVDISGRNTVGYFLKDQTFDEHISWTGTSNEIMEAILAYAGVKKYRVQPGSGTTPFKFTPDTSILDGIQKMIDYYSYADQAWTMVEIPDGTILVGYEWWIAQEQRNSYYSFDEGKNVFKRKTTKLSDSSYTSIRVTGKNASDQDLTPVTVAVSNFPYWSLGAHRTAHISAPDGMTQTELQAWATAYAKRLQYIGIGEDFTTNFRPDLLVGDVAEVVDGSVGTSLGIITEVRQTFSRTDGFKTEFSVDSGGITTDGQNYTVYSRTAQINGYNRRQRIIDLVRIVSGK